MRFSGAPERGSPRRDRPEDFGKWSSVYRQFRRGTLCGLWEDILETINGRKLVPDALQMIDSTVVRAHHQSAGAKGGINTKLHAVADAKGRPIGFGSSMPSGGGHIINALHMTDGGDARGLSGSKAGCAADCKGQTLMNDRTQSPACRDARRDGTGIRLVGAPWG